MKYYEEPKIEVVKFEVPGVMLDITSDDPDEGWGLLI